jgi:spermidine synthase
MTAPTPAEMTASELDRAIVDASREYIAAQRARPRDQARITDAKAALDALIALRDAGI